MVGIVIVSHSPELAAGATALAREMGGPRVSIESAGGLEEPGALGTDAERVRSAIERAMSPEGVLVLMDLGSALMSAEFAVEMLAEGADRVRLSSAPLVEGAVAAAAAAAGGAELAEVAAQADRALGMKTAQLASEPSAPESPPAPGGGAGPPSPPDAHAELPVINEIGLHARPAARLTELVRHFDAEVLIARWAGERPVRATSLTDLVGLGARRGDTLTVTARGPEAGPALDALRALAEGGFGDGPAAGPSQAPPAPRRPDPPPPPIPSANALRPGPGETLRGAGASPGVAVGPARPLRVRALLTAPPDRPAQPPDRERARLQEAIEAAQRGVRGDREALAARIGPADAEILDVQTALLDDPALLERADAAIAGGAVAERAWYDAAQAVAALYRGLDVPLLQGRATDVLDAGRRVLSVLDGATAASVAGAGIVIAAELAPGDVAALDPATVTGVATAHGATTAHAAILVRSLGIPAVLGLGDAVLGIEEGTSVLLDGDAGTLIADPPAETVRTARERVHRAAAWQAMAAERAQEPGRTRDGTPIEVAANLGGVAEAERAVAAGAQGVGLLRTEFLYLDRDELPDEDEQAGTLSQITAILRGRPLVVRTLDAGADKPLRSLPMAPEANPFLGLRGIRLGLARPEVLTTQLRAILRAARSGPLRVMVPMVATPDEVRAVRHRLDEARAATGIDDPVELGIMVEVPAAALTAARLAEQVDFFSIGTNDLTQYTMAAERGDERLAPLLDGCQPAVLRLIDATTRAARAHDRWVGACGELAGDPAAAVLLVGLGVTELSMAPALIPAVKATLRTIDLADARTAAAAALDAADGAQARALAIGLLGADHPLSPAAATP